MSRKDITLLFKRFLITFCLMLPIFIGIGFLLQDKVSDAVMIIIFVTIGGAGIALEEYISYNRRKKREEQKEKQKKGDKE